MPRHQNRPDRLALEFTQRVLRCHGGDDTWLEARNPGAVLCLGDCESDRLLDPIVRCAVDKNELWPIPDRREHLWG